MVQIPRNALGYWYKNSNWLFLLNPVEVIIENNICINISGVN